MKSVFAEKNYVDFLDIGSVDSIDNCKSGFLCNSINEVNEIYPQIKISFEDVQTDVFLPTGIKSNNHFMEQALEILSKTNVHFVNKAESEFDDLFNDLKQHFNGAGVIESDDKRRSFGCFEVRLIHDKKYYQKNGLKDPHTSDSQMFLYQHITIERLEEMKKNSWGSLIGNCIENLAVKMENYQSRLLLTEWPFLKTDGSPLDSDYTFATSVDSDEDEDKEYAAITITSDGRIKDICYLDYEVDYDLIESLSLDPVHTEYAVMDSSGNINVVKETGLFCIPNADEIRQKWNDNLSADLRSDGFRDLEGRNKYLSECVDINYFCAGDSNLYYYVGYVGAGTKLKFPRAANIRLVQTYGDSKLFLDDLMTMMSVPYVRHNQCTVQPFPLKNLREWTESNKNPRME